MRRPRVAGAGSVGGCDRWCDRCNMVAPCRKQYIRYWTVCSIESIVGRPGSCLQSIVPKRPIRDNLAEMFGGAMMRNTKADRRSQRTRQLVHTALIELMLERRYDEITVQDIIDRANVGRSTFYAHYLDKEDLLVSGFTQVLDALRQHMEQHQQGDWRTPPGLAFFFQHVQTHHQLYKALVRGGGIELLYKKGHERLRQNIEQHLVALVPAGRTPAAPAA